MVCTLSCPAYAAWPHCWLAHAGCCCAGATWSLRLQAQCRICSALNSCWQRHAQRRRLVLWCGLQHRLLPLCMGCCRVAAHRLLPLCLGLPTNVTVNAQRRSWTAVSSCCQAKRIVQDPCPVCYSSDICCAGAYQLLQMPEQNMEGQLVCTDVRTCWGLPTVPKA